MKKRFILLLGSLLLVGGPSATNANPVGGVVQAGTATITAGGPGSLTINQATDKAIINWNSFSIGAGEATRFVQPSASATALNRVMGGNPSSIYGMLQANGNVIVINPAGILVGPSGVINTHSFMGSTLDINNSSFLSGVGMKFSGNSTAGVKNEGTINAIGGDIFLFAHTVDNIGALNATEGTVGLAAGSEILLKQTGNEKVSVLAGNVAAPRTATGVNNAGAVKSASAELKAAGGNMYALAINNGGVVRADTVVDEGGRIFLRASGGNIQNSGTLAATAAGGKGGSITMDGGHNSADPATVINSGVMDAHGDTGKGGSISILGDHVGLFGSALVDVSGATGGGTALIGGDLRGENPDVQNAERAYVNTDARILADATDSGNGGKIIVWADDVTRYYGSISAQGGPSGGNGGFAEVSGKNSLIFEGTADLRARSETGTPGQLLLDPKTIIVSTNDPGGGATNRTAANQLNAFATNPTEISWVRPTDLVTLLNTADVLFQANTDIRFLDDVDASGGNNNNFTLQAGRSILVGVAAPVTLRIHGQFTATVNDAGATGNRDPGPGDFNMFAGSLIDTGSGTAATDRTISISMGAGSEVGDITIANLSTSPPAPGVNGGQVTLQNTTGDITVTGTIDTSGRTMTSGNAAGGNAGAISLTTTTGTIDTSGGSLLANGGSANGNNANGGLGGTITLTAGSGIIDTSTGTLTANGGDATGTGNPNGGAGGHVTLTNGSGGANVGPITANGGAGNGTGSPGDAGTIIVTSGGPITVNSDLTARIGTNGSGGTPTPGSITLAPTNGGGAVSGIGTITTDTLNLNGVGSIGTLISPLNTAVNLIFLTRGGGAGSVFVSDPDNVNLRGDTGGGNLTVTANDVGVPNPLNSGAGVISFVAANNRSIVLGTGGTAADLTLSGGDLQNITTSGGLTLKTSAPGTITVTGITGGNSTNVSGAVTLDSGSDLNFSTTPSAFRILDARAAAASAININAAVTTSSSQTYTANTINIAADLSSSPLGASSLTLQPLDPTLSIGIGSLAAGGLLFNDTALGHLKDGFSSITFGRTDGQHAIDINTAVAFTDPVVFRSPIAPGSITVNGKLVGTNNASITLNGSHATTTLNADIVTSGTAININDKVVLGTAALVTLDTTAGNTSPAGAAIHIFDTINDDATPSTLVTISGTAGITTLDNDIGNLFPLSGFQASGVELVLGGANLRTDFGGPVNFNGLTRVTLGNNLTIRTDVTADAGVAGPITFGTATVNGNAAGRTLVLDATGAGGDTPANVFLGPVGNTTPLGALTVRGNGLTLNNNVNVDGTGGVNFTGVFVVFLGGNVTIDTDATGGATAAGAVNFGSALIENSASSLNLIVDATSDSGAAGAVTLGPVGQFLLPLASLNVSGGSISAQAVRTTGNQTYTSDTIALNGNLFTTAAGTLTLQPLGNATTIGIGTGAVGTFSLDNTELAFLVDGFSAINIGRAAGSHAIDVTTASFTDNVNFRASTGTVTLHNDLQNDTGGGFDFSGVSSVVLANTVTIDTDLAGGATSAGAVTFGTTPVTANAVNRSLTVDASADGGGTAASVTLAAVGTGITPLNTLTVSGNNLSLNGTVNASTVVLSAAGTLSGAGSITANALGLTIANGIGSVGTPISTAVANLEASATTGGIFINNTGNLIIGGVTPTLNGIRATAGNIVLNNTGSVTINTPGDTVSGPGNITIAANGPTANLQTGGNLAAIRSTAGSLTLSAGQDLLLGTATGINTGHGDIFGQTGLLLTAGRDIVIDANTFVDANGGTIVGTAARNFTMSHVLFTAPHIIGSGAVDITLTATAGTLTLDSASGTVQSTGGTISLNAPSASAVSIVDSVNAGAAGTVTLNHNGALTGTGLITAGALNLQGNGTVGSGVGRLRTTVDTIIFNKPAGGSFISETDGVNVQGTAAAMDVAAGGAIGQSGALNVTGAAAFKTLNAAGAAITLDRIGDTVNNSFGSISAQVRNAADTADAAAAVTIHENAVDGTVLAGVRTLGTLNVVSSGPITQTAPVVANGAGQTATFSAVGNAINLGNAGNDFNTVLFTGAAVALTDANGLNLGASTATGNLNVTALGGAITQSGTLTANGPGTTASFNAVGNTIGLGNPNNDFTTALFTGANVTLTDQNSLILGTSTATGDLILTTGGNLTQSGVLTANGAANFAAFIVSAANSDILLGGQANDIRFGFFGLSGAGTIHDLALRSINAAPVLGLPTTIGNDLTLTFNNAGITLPTVSVGGNLSVTAGGTIGQSGPLTVTGVGKTASFTAVGNTILLGDLNNDFGTAAFSGANVTLVDKNALILGTSTATGNLTVSTTGNITQSGALTANGAGMVAVFNPGSVNNVDLSLNNNFTSVSVPSATDITLNDVDGYSLGAIKAAGTLDLRSTAGDITQLFPGSPAAGPTVEAQILKGSVGGALVLGSLVDATVQPFNKIGTIGALSHGTSATLTLPSSINSSAQVPVGLYIFDSDSTAYSGSTPNPVPGNAGAVLGLVINGLVTGTGTTVIRTQGDLELVGASGAKSVETTASASDILLSAENDGNFHNLLGFGGVLDGSKAVSPGGTSRFLIFSTDSTKNFGNAITGGQLKFNELSTVNLVGKGFLADQVSFNNKPTPIKKQDGTPDDGLQDGFVFVVKQNFIQQDESAKFFLDLINLVVFSSVDATAKAAEKPRDDPPTIWTSSYHIYEQEQLAKDKKSKQVKKLSSLNPFWEIQLEGKNSWTSSRLVL